MKKRFLIGVLFLVIIFTNAQSITETDLPTVAILGSFHFAGSSDLIAMKVDDLKSSQRQNEIEALVDALAAFKPTKVIVEYPYGKMRLDSLYQSYLKDEHELTINERQQIGFRLAKKMGHSHIYAGDHKLDLPFNELMKFLEQNRQMQKFQNLIEYMKTEVLSLMQTTYETTSLKDYFIWMNSEKFDKMNKGLYLQTVNNMGSENNYAGTNVVTKWWERNFKIMRNIDEIMEPNDRVFVLFGQGHTALLKDFYKDRDDIIYEDILEYLKN
ncbi:DUF5694 domain-containing protein [uncultured Psychroserpens sp.]|uniref:DUF5694 domain-containing protein n=1 Tax=uncultured Psychroserpens sp. TaxID=255436 RepID=UPI002607B38A|nr:DUF5694 domain-containing protein [uncultured Psychroserpens sp.]